MPNRRKWDYEEGFLYWYNDGDRRSWDEVRREFGVARNTVVKAADANDWKARADKLDEEARAKVDKGTVSRVAERLEESLTITDHLISMFGRRLLPTARDADGNVIPNPDALRPGDLTPHDYRELVKLRQLLTGGATERPGEEVPMQTDLVKFALALEDATPDELAALEKVYGVEGGGDGEDQGGAGQGGDAEPEPVRGADGKSGVVRSRAKRVANEQA